MSETRPHPGALVSGISLTDLNEKLHRHLDDQLLAVIEHLTELDVEKAQTGWILFEERMNRHARMEHALIFPLYRDVSPDGMGGAIGLFEADHQALEDLAVSCGAAIRALLESKPAERRRVVLMLDKFYQVRHLFEHHTLREQEFLYPAADSVVEPKQRANIAASLGSCCA